MTIDLAEIQRELVQRIESHPMKGVVLVVYLYGSSLRENFKHSSDIDLAFLVDEHRYKEDAFIATALVQGIADEVFIASGREVDVTVLNAASLEMAYEIITTGFCLFETDPDVRLEYEIKVKGLYFDFQPFLFALRSKKIAQLGSLEVQG
jgi:predicted nucleotidyltransferase